MLLKGIKNLLYNDGYTIRGVQKVIKENGTKKILSVNAQNNDFTLIEKDNKQHSAEFNETSHTVTSETKRNKLKNVLNDLIELKNNLDKN